MTRAFVKVPTSYVGWIRVTPGAFGHLHGSMAQGGPHSGW